MKILILLISIVSFTSCTYSNDDFEEWKIYKIGENEGGGVFYEDTDSNKTIRFNADRTVEISNGNWCSIRDHSEINTGVLDELNNQIITNCYGTDRVITFSISSMDILYLTYPGIELSFELYQRSN